MILAKGLIFIITAGGLLVAAVVTGVGTYRFIRSAASAPGVVTHLRTGGSHPEIEFTTALGEKISYPQGGLIFGYWIGKKVQVLYHQENPRGSACIKAFGALWFVPLMLLGLGLGLLIGGVMFLLEGKPHP